MEATTRFELTISLNVLEHLGINLYSNVPSVLSEIVANAWDADATEVRIDWDQNKSRIVIQDDGVGMTPEDVNARFLMVGYRRRDRQPGITGKKRRPMGRKGIGKLSLFSIANSVRIETKKDDIPSAFQMYLDDIREKIRDGEGPGTYVPEPVDITGIDFGHGTRITLTNLHRRQTISTPQALRKRVARRFSILGPKHEFRVFINSEEVVPADRGYYDKLQYLWTYGDSDDVKILCKNTLDDEDRTDMARNGGISVTGWLGTIAESKQLKDEEGDNLNRIAIFVRGKMAQENMLNDFSERGVYATYLIGELRFDDLDTYDGGETSCDKDAATSSRQCIVEDDPRYQKLRRFLGDELKHIQKRWAKWRGKAGTRKALEIPAVKEWMDALKPPTRQKAERWLGKLNRIRLDEDEEEDLKHHIKHSILGFEFYRANENLEALDSISDESLPLALKIFQELDVLEANLYGQIVQQRLKVIRTLQEKVATNSLERVIQKYLFDHLWILDPSWERAEGTEIMERKVAAMFSGVDKHLSNNDLKGRLDIGYRKTAGQHVIVELKRPGLTVSVSKLTEQVRKYKLGMDSILKKQDTPTEPIDIIVLLDKQPNEWCSEDERSLNIYNGRIVFYDKLLADAEQVYCDYFKSRKLVDKLSQIMSAIDDYAPPPSS